MRQEAAGAGLWGYRDGEGLYPGTGQGHTPQDMRAMAERAGRDPRGRTPAQPPRPSPQTFRL